MTPPVVSGAAGRKRERLVSWTLVSVYLSSSSSTARLQIGRSGQQERNTRTTQPPRLAERRRAESSEKPWKPRLCHEPTAEAKRRIDCDGRGLSADVPRSKTSADVGIIPVASPG